MLKRRKRRLVNRAALRKKRFVANNKACVEDDIVNIFSKIEDDELRLSVYSKMTKDLNPGGNPILFPFNMFE